MANSDKWFRWCFNLFMFLLCFQVGMLLFLKSLFFRAEQRLKDNAAEVAFRCGDFNGPESYWSLPPGESRLDALCEGPHCPDNFWKQETQGEAELHVVSAEKAQPSYMKEGELQRGHFVDVHIQSTKKPLVLALVNQNMMQWNLKLPKNHKLKEVLVIGPELVWVDGLPEDVPMTYFSRDQICAFPNSWEELQNGDNQFRRLAQALKKYSQLDVSSFQGKRVGRQFRVPLRLSTFARKKDRQVRALASTVEGLGIQWSRQGRSLLAQSFSYLEEGETKTLSLPPKVSDAFFDEANKSLYVINNFQFGLWEDKTQNFKPIHLPLKLPALYWPISLTFNPLTSEIYIYNDDRGGELFAFNVVTKSWRLLAQKVGYSLVALHFDRENRWIYGSRFEAKKVQEVLRFDESGRPLSRQPLEPSFDFAKNHWRIAFVQEAENLHLRVAHPADPKGELRALKIQKSPSL